MLALFVVAGLVETGYAGVPTATLARMSGSPLSVEITKVSPALRIGRSLALAGTVSNPGTVHWQDARVYLEVAFTPATTPTGLDQLAAVPVGAPFGHTVTDPHGVVAVGNVPPGQQRPFSLSVPYRWLAISGAAGAYRVGVEVVASNGDPTSVDNVVHAGTLMPLLPSNGPIVPAQTVTLLPITGTVKRLLGGVFADDSLAASISFGGRLRDILDWAIRASTDTVQVVVDPALLVAITDMSHGYRVQSPQSATASVPGMGRTQAISWLNDFEHLTEQQHVLLMPWGNPAANTLLRDQLPGPVVASIRASRGFLPTHGYAAGVAGWLVDGRSGIRAVTVMHHAGADLQIVSEASLPDIAANEDASGATPPLLEVPFRHRHIPMLVTAPTLAGFQTAPKTTALQFRQRLIADAAVRSLSGETDQITVTALPFTWDPGPAVPGSEFASAFRVPVIVAQSALGAVDRPGHLYRGLVRPGATGVQPISTAILSEIHAYRIAGGNLASILHTSVIDQRKFDRTFAMCGSTEWRRYPALGVRLIAQQAEAALGRLAKVAVTGPPFVAMSSNSGRFPLTVTNGLNHAIRVKLVVTPANPALKVAPIPDVILGAGQRRDIQVVSTADGSGVTSVRARLATLQGARFGKGWRFDVRATQIGLVIWVVMGAGGTVLFVAAGYRIVNRLRGGQTPRRQAQL
jgi:hypothetical protein